MRLIDADALMENYGLKDATKYGNKDAEQQEHSYSTLMLYEIADIIEDAPTVEAKPVVYGEWKRVGSGSLYDTYECTNCHRQPKWDCLGDNHWRIAFTDICPYCGAIMNGADMRGEKHD